MKKMLFFIAAMVAIATGLKAQTMNFVNNTPCPVQVEVHPSTGVCTFMPILAVMVPGSTTLNAISVPVAPEYEFVVNNIWGLPNTLPPAYIPGSTCGPDTQTGGPFSSSPGCGMAPANLTITVTTGTTPVINDVTFN